MKSKLLTKEIVETLSPLETEITRVIKPRKTYDVRTIYILLRRKKKIAKSSVSVLLDRLYRKGVVNRGVDNSSGKLKFLYKLELDKERYEKQIVDNAVKFIIQKFGSKAISYFNESLKNRRRK